MSMSLIADLTAASEAVHQQHRDCASLRQGLANGELRFHFQPVMNSGRAVGAEALVRWHLPDGAVRFPGPWLDCLSFDGKLADVFEDALWGAAVEFANAFPHIRVNVNTVPERVTEVGWAEVVLRRLQLLGGRPEQFTIEITEGSMLLDSPGVRRNLEAVRAAGCHIALDDFGEGNANLTTFMAFHDLIDTVKVDKLLVQHEDRRAARCLISFARSFSKHVVAEGVETEDQAEFLRQVGVQCHQGWLYAKAMDPADFLLFDLANGFEL